MSTDFPKQARELVFRTLPKNSDYSIDDVYVVWFCYILGGWKALVSTTIEDGKYYVVTNDFEKNSTYLDVYMKLYNIEYIAEGGGDE